MKLKYLILTCTAITAGSSFGAVTLGSDSANDSAYNPNWTTGTDGGTPGTFGAWTLTNTAAQAGRFIGDSATLAAPGANINTVGESFGMFGHSSQSSDAFRDFNGNTLGVGQTLSLSLAVNFRNGNKGFDLRNSADAVIFNFNIGADNYIVNNAATGNGSIGSAYASDTAFNLSFTQTSGSGGTWSIVRSGGVTDSDSGTYTGVAENFKFYISSTTGNGASQDNLYFNNLTVVPEPSAALLGGLGALMLLRRRRN